MGAGPNSHMGSLSVLVVEGNAHEREIITQILLGFKVSSVTKQASAEDAMSYIQKTPADLLIVAAALPKMDGYDFTRHFRATKTVRSRMAPVLLMTGHTRACDVARARDCGASLVITRPTTPHILFQRIAWLAGDARTFIETPAYTGPDRRFQAFGPPPDTCGRRKDDLPEVEPQASLPVEAPL